ncbi:ATP-binding protein [bacterium]|nr:ATP-binding protein [bacterium]
MLQAQLEHFYNSLKLQGLEPCEKPHSWLDAFLLLEKLLQERDDGSRQLVFLDELPWMDTPRSGFLRAFEGFWNTWGCHRKNLMVIVCGSANSWILDRLINNRGGLYNRLTFAVRLSPFTLSECEAFFQNSRIQLSRYDIAQSYMIFGGIPYYLGYIEPELSLAQNVDNLFFSRNAILKDEYDRLFDSMFANPETIKAIVRLLYTRNAGFTRKEIAAKLGISDGGRLTEHLKALLASDFLEKYVPFGLSRREEHYKLTDPFCLFYLHFVQKQRERNEHFWAQNVTSQPVVTWRGYAFENVCFNHVEQIKKALGISGVITSSSAWSKESDDEAGSLIDLLISRRDNVINMCEIKFYSGDFIVNKDYYRTLLSRQEMLSQHVSRKISVHSTLITTFGLKRNEYSGAFTNVVTLDDLFV